MRRTLLSVALAFAAVPDVSAEPPLAERANAVLRARCYQCHVEQRSGSKAFDLLSRDQLIEEGYLDLENPGESLLYQRVVVDKDMPPPGRKGEAQISQAERELLDQWLKAGAPFPESEQQRARKEISAVLTSIRDHLKEAFDEDRKYLRYFTLVIPYNMPSTVVSERQLRLYRAGLSTALNSLHWSAEIVVPEQIDEEGTVFAIDLRDLIQDVETRKNWYDTAIWEALLAKYPYGVSFSAVQERKLRQIDEEIQKMSGSPLAYIRADWFVANATRPPLYHDILGLPERLQQLETQLKVDRAGEFESRREVRGAVSRSGVAHGPRVLSRHTSLFGYYWISYDFKQRLPQDPDDRKDPILSPFGPAEHRSREALPAFLQDGGEVIFSLPNRMQAYLLVDGEGDRIETAPTEVVEDDEKTSGSSAIVNGLSCIGCHKQGMKDFDDVIREGTSFQGSIKIELDRLYIPRSRMKRILDRDGAGFRQAAREATSQFLVDSSTGATLGGFSEPVQALARFYQSQLTLLRVSVELHEDQEEFRRAIKSNDLLTRIGLKALETGTIPREKWETRLSSDHFFNTLYQETARLWLKRVPRTVYQRRHNN